MHENKKGRIQSGLKTPCEFVFILTDVLKVATLSLKVATK
jgi:hypothetical protein